MKVSFIIPVFNSEEFLSCCINSVIKQTEQDIEIICINDCSSDRSQSILESYANKDPRITIIEFRENKGPGVARNAGLEVATGEFIRMVDADDFIPLTSTEKLLAAADKYKSNFIRGGFWSCSGSGEKISKGWGYPEKETVNTNIKEEQRLWRFDQHWAYLYRSKALKASGARYDESMRNGQDAAFLVRLMPYFDRVTFIPETVYYYRDNPVSTTHRKRSKDFYFNVLALYSKAYKELDKYDLSEIAEYVFYFALCYYLPGEKIFSRLSRDLAYDDAIEVLTYCNKILIEQKGLLLCFDNKYSWQHKRQMPPQSKFLLLLIAGGYLDDAYEQLKCNGQNQRNEQVLQKKLDALYASTSWKVTGPLRKVIGFFR